MFSRYRSRFSPVVFFNAEGAGAGGSTPPVTPPVEPDKVEPPKIDKADIQGIVRQTIADVMGSKRVSGDTSQALEVLAARALKEEQRAKAAEAKIGVIPDDVKKTLGEYEELGKLDDIKKQLDELKALQTEKVTRERTDAFRKAATVAGYDPDAVLEVIGEVPEAQVDKVNADGKEVEKAAVKVLLSDGKEELKPFDEFMKSRFARVHESLKANSKAQVKPPIMGVNGAGRNSEDDARKAQSLLYGSSNF